MFVAYLTTETFVKGFLLVIVADPGFPRGACQPIIWQFFCRKLQENDKFWKEGACHWRSLGSAADLR